jgi:hypothetical protein
VIVSISLPIACHSAAWVRASALRSSALSLAKAFSIGLSREADQEAGE